MITIGGQNFSLLIDTGSSDLWVFSDKLPSNVTVGHSIYAPPGSAAVLKGQTFDIEYADGSGASGPVYADKVAVAGVTATSQAVEAATAVSDEWAGMPVDGVLGLGFSSINQVRPTKQSNFFDSIKSQLSSALFTSTLRRNAPGSYDFGYIDSTRYTGPITYLPINNTLGYWMFSGGQYKIGSKSYNSTIGTSIADTGTSLLFLPIALTVEYYAQVKNSTFSIDDGGFEFPCNAVLPDLQVQLGGTYFTIPGSYMNYCPVDDDGTICFGSLQASGGVSIFGLPFLNSVYAIWDQTQSSPRLGLAKQAKA